LMVPRTYFSDLQHHAPLSRVEEDRLTARLKNRPSVVDRDRLITSNLRYVVAVAMRYRNCGMPLEDLINEGNLGLIEAVSRYDPTRGTRFLTYATWWIRKAILGSLTKQTLVRVPPSRQKQIRRARQEEGHARLMESSESPGSEDSSRLSDDLEKAVTKLDALLGTTPKELSLEDAWGFNGERVVDDLMASRDQVTPEHEMLNDERKETIQNAVARLSRVERTIIRGRFGLDESTPRTLREIGVDLGISRERVRQIEIRSKEKIRRAVSNPRPRRRPPAMH